MAKRKLKTNRKTSPDGSKVHVYLLVPVVLHQRLHSEAKAGGFKNVQDKIIDVLRQQYQTGQQEQAA